MFDPWALIGVVREDDAGAISVTGGGILRTRVIAAPGSASAGGGRAIGGFAGGGASADVDIDSSPGIVIPAPSGADLVVCDSDVKRRRY